MAAGVHISCDDANEPCPRARSSLGPHHWGPDGETGQAGAAPPTGRRRTAEASRCCWSYSPAWRCPFQFSPNQPTIRSLTVTSPTAEAHTRYFVTWLPGLESNVGGLFWAFQWTEAHRQPSTGSSAHLLVARHAGNLRTDNSGQG